MSRRTGNGAVQGPHPAGYSDERLDREIRVTFGRASGPGGQHRNKVETAVVIQHTSTAVRGEASERRSQEENRRTALFRLRTNLWLVGPSTVVAGGTFD